MSNVRDYTHRAANSRAEDCIGCGRHQEHPVADASGEGPYCKTCAEHSNGGFGDPALALPAAQADGSPRIWGVEMPGLKTADRPEPYVWERSFGELPVTIQRAGLTFDAFVGEVAIACSASLPEAALAIEAELTRIETEIRTAREGKK